MILLNYFIFGALISSFLLNLTDRFLKNKELWFTPSMCDWCQKKIKPLYLIPIFGYFLSQGHCPSCKASIQKKYFLLEWIAALLASWLYFVKGSVSFQDQILYAFIFGTFIVISYADFLVRIIYNRFIIAPIIIKIIIILINQEYQNIIILLVETLFLLLIMHTFSYLYLKFRKIEGIGGGDLNLLAMLCFVLGLKAIPFIIFWSSLLGIIIYVPIFFFQKELSIHKELPFGPLIALGTFIYLNYKIFYLS